MLAQEIIRTKRDGKALSVPQIESFVQGLVDQSWSEGQVAALAMAIFLNGAWAATSAVALTLAMMRLGPRA
jgi:thymidine phosphorylase